MALSARYRRPASDHGSEPVHARKQKGCGDSGAALAPALYLVATPIGNTRDITVRALDILREVDVIACEDTRVTAKLLATHGIRRPLLSYREHNAARAGPALLERIRRGERVALVTDAGTPLISDPGSLLVTACIDASLPVVPIPGVSAPVAALMVAGLPSDRFMFVGFLPARRNARRRAIGELTAIPATLVLMEAPHRLPDALADLADLLGPRPAAIARELTKLFEEVRRGTLSDLAAHYAASGSPKGEVTMVIGPPKVSEPDAALAHRMLEQELKTDSARNAAVRVASATGISRRVLYAQALALKAEAAPGPDDD
jgi:16S rRNA (cytidine1402-2'-O)-methyltransferase